MSKSVFFILKRGQAWVGRFTGNSRSLLQEIVGFFTAADVLSVLDSMRNLKPRDFAENRRVGRQGAVSARSQVSHW